MPSLFFAETATSPATPPGPHVCLGAKLTYPFFPVINRDGYSGSSSSSGGEERRPGDQEEELKRLRAQVEKQQSAWKRQEAQGVPTRRGSGLEDDCKMEVEEETDCKKKLDEQKKSLHRQLRDVEKFANMDPVFRDRQIEKWKEDLQEIERKGTELSLEHQKMQKTSQKLQSIQDKQRKYFKDACACEEEMQLLHQEMKERKTLFETRVPALSEKSGDCREGIPARQRDSSRSPRGKHGKMEDDGLLWLRWKEGENWQKEKSKNSQGKDSKTFEGNSQGKDPSTFHDRSHQWRVHKKWKKEKWRKRKKKEKEKKKVKCRKRRWWKKVPRIHHKVCVF